RDRRRRTAARACQHTRRALAAAARGAGRSPAHPGRRARSRRGGPRSPDGARGAAEPMTKAALTVAAPDPRARRTRAADRWARAEMRLRIIGTFDLSAQYHLA